MSFVSELKQSLRKILRSPAQPLPAPHSPFRRLNYMAAIERVRGPVTRAIAEGGIVAVLEIVNEHCRHLADLNVADPYLNSDADYYRHIDNAKAVKLAIDFINQK